MYLLYIDDSGTCDLKKDAKYGPNGGESRFFVLGAVLIKADELNRIDSEIDKIKVNCFGNNLAEIKSNIKSLKCQTSCSSEYNKMCFRKKVSSFIINTDCVLFAVAQDKYKTTQNGVVRNKNDIYKLAFENLLKLVDIYMYNNAINENTICFIDKKNSGDEMDTLIYQAYKEALMNKNIFKSFSNHLFCPSINVVYSQYTLGVQLADFVAGSIRRALENHDNPEETKEAKIITNILKAKFYQDNGTIIGFSFANNWVQ